MKGISWLTVCAVFVSGASGVYTDLSVIEGDSVTLHTDAKIKQQDSFKWYFRDTRIAQLDGDLRFICTDVQCNEGTEGFRDRLKLNHQTGSLTIITINTADSGEYTLKIISRDSVSEKNLSISVHGVSAVKQEEVKSVKKGDPVTLNTNVIKNSNDVMTWTFNDTVIAELSGDKSKICSDGQCKMRFEDRLKLDHQTGSLNITNTRITDSGVYTLEITRSGFGFRRRRRSVSITSVKSFSVSVIDPGLSSYIVGGIVAAVLIVVVAAAAGLVYKICVPKQWRPQGRYIKGSQQNPN